MRRRPVSEQIDFPYEDIIISRTDGRGVIQSANDTFVRISGYDRADLIGAPHKILRHDAMPKGVFFAIWAELLKGNPVSGYVRNRTKNGDYYWVFATISPIEDGFISMRVRPEADAVEMVAGLYDEMLKREKNEGFSPEQSAGFMVEGLMDRGFGDHANFMGTKLAQEVTARDRALGRKTNATLGCLQALLPHWKEVEKRCETVFKTYATFGEVPSNLRLQARNLNEGGASLGAVAVNFTTIAAKITSDLEKYSASLNQANRSVSRALFMSATQHLMSEAQAVLTAEGASEREMGILSEQASTYLGIAMNEAGDVRHNLDRFWRGSKRIKRDFTGLSMTRVMCAIETAKVPYGKADHIRSIIEELDRFQRIGDEGLDRICSDLEAIKKHTEVLAQIYRHTAGLDVAS